MIDFTPSEQSNQSAIDIWGEKNRLLKVETAGHYSRPLKQNSKTSKTIIKLTSDVQECNESVVIYFANLNDSDIEIPTNSSKSKFYCSYCDKDFNSNPTATPPLGTKQNRGNDEEFCVGKIQRVPTLQSGDNQLPIKTRQRPSLRARKRLRALWHRHNSGPRTSARM